MSQSEILRFTEYLKANPQSVPKLDKHRLPWVMKFAAEQGYAFTLDEAKTYIQARARTRGRELSDEQLDKVAGGWGSCQESLHCCL
jgi:predicted ribosomally synthesized peptide with nif11-like leader